ncbi:unnamed protein product [Rhizoctonia solani]|uniref:Uncharacterized protein n=1 Tax=Rhizoctonia solani TaxID=456999 RepID=A0A8H3BDW4_9AGAM|nr:unnamed protein product [Rhizoctonia solani]
MWVVTAQSLSAAAANVSHPSAELFSPGSPRPIRASLVGASSAGADDHAECYPATSLRPPFEAPPLPLPMELPLPLHRLPLISVRRLAAVIVLLRPLAPPLQPLLAPAVPLQYPPSPRKPLVSPVP